MKVSERVLASAAAFDDGKRTTSDFSTEEVATRFLYAQATHRSGYGSHSIVSVKQASVLFDEVIFERRFSVIDDVPWDEVADRYDIPESAIAEERAQHPEWGQRELGRFMRNVDAEEKAALEAAGVLLSEDASTSEFFGDDPEAPPLGHGAFNNILQILAEKGCDWVRDVIVAPRKLPQIPAMPGDGSWRREARAVAEVHGAVLYGGLGAREPLGGSALAILVPNLGELPWQAIAEFRAHPGSVEARHRLRDFDGRAQRETLELQDIQRFEQHVGEEITRSLLAAWAETRPRMGAAVANEAVKTGIGFIPLAGPALSATSSIVETAWKQRGHDRSWLSALWNLITSSDRSA